MTEIKVLDSLTKFRNDPDNQARIAALKNSPHAREQYSIAAKYLRRFFAGKNNIETSRVVTMENITTVLNTAMCPGIDMFYIILASRRVSEQDQIKYFISILHESRRLKIPQHLIAGIACVHAHLVGKWTV